MYFALVDTPIFNQTILRLLYDEAGMLLLLKAKLQHCDVSILITLNICK